MTVKIDGPNFQQISYDLHRYAPDMHSKMAPPIMGGGVSHSMASPPSNDDYNHLQKDSPYFNVYEEPNSDDMSHSSMQTPPLNDFNRSNGDGMIHSPMQSPSLNDFNDDSPYKDSYSLG